MRLFKFIFKDRTVSLYASSVQDAVLTMKRYKQDLGQLITIKGDL